MLAKLACLAISVASSHTGFTDSVRSTAAARSNDTNAHDRARNTAIRSFVANKHVEQQSGSLGTVSLYGFPRDQHTRASGNANFYDAMGWLRGGRGERRVADGRRRLIERATAFVVLA